MAELMVVGFEGTHRAAEVLEQVQALTAHWESTTYHDDAKLFLDDAVAVYRKKDGRLRLDRSVRPTPGQGASVGGLLGAVLGAVLAAPFTAGASAAIAAAAIGSSAVVLGVTGAVLGADDVEQLQKESGLTEDFVRQVGGLLQPGWSAVFVVGDTPDPEGIAERFHGYGGTVLRSTLTPDRAAKFQQLLDSKRAVPA